jgi:hypothetical protein
MVADDLVDVCSERDAATAALDHTARLRRWTIWNAARLLRDVDMPHMRDDTLDMLTELAYMSVFPMLCEAPRLAYTGPISRASAEVRLFFSRLLGIAKKSLAWGHDDLATDRDWEEWIDSM